MKNLDKWRIIEGLLAASVLVLLALPIGAIFLLKASFPELIEAYGMGISIALMAVCWISAFVILGVNTKKAVIIDAMVKNRKRVVTNRVSFPSERRNVTVEALRSAFKERHFTVTDLADGGFVAETSFPKHVTVTVLTLPEDPRGYLKEFEKKHQETRYNFSSVKSHAVVFLAPTVTEEHRELALDSVLLPTGCFIPVFYETLTDRAYYMGGDCGRTSPEAPVQKVLKNIVLGVKGDFPEKTEADKTAEELELEKLDLEEIFEQMKSAPSEDKAYVVKMEDGALDVVRSEYGGVIYFKKGIKGMSAMFTCDPENEKKISIDSLEALMYCSPKVKQASIDDKLAFKKALEKYLDENGFEYSYKK